MGVGDVRGCERGRGIDGEARRARDRDFCIRCLGNWML